METEIKKEEVKSVQKDIVSKPIPEPIKQETKINDQEEEVSKSNIKPN